MGTNSGTILLGEILQERREEPIIDDLVSGKVRIIEKISFFDGEIHLRDSPNTNTKMENTSWYSQTSNVKS